MTSLVQLESVIQLLEQDPQSAELLQLKHDLETLVELEGAERLLAESTGLNVEDKNRGYDRKAIVTEDLDPEEQIVVFKDESDQETLGITEKPSEFIVSDKCVIPYPQDSCLIFLPSLITHIDNEASLATVLITIPVSKSSKPCSDYLSGQCDRRNCLYSHGHIVPLDHLLPMEVVEHQSKQFEIGDKALGLYTDGLFYKVTIVRVEPHIVTVTYDGYGQAKVDLTEEKLFPIISVDLDQDSGGGAGGGGMRSIGEECEQLSLNRTMHLPEKDGYDSDETVFSDEFEDEMDDDRESGDDAYITHMGSEDYQPVKTFKYDDGLVIGDWDSKGVATRYLMKMGYKV
jgi:hypothetical protein